MSQDVIETRLKPCCKATQSWQMKKQSLKLRSLN